MKQIRNLWKKYSYVFLLAFLIFGLFDLRFAVVTEWRLSNGFNYS